jgi:proteic killer suppression protein
MIKNFRHKGLRLLWEEGKATKLPTDQIQRITNILRVIDDTQSVPRDFEFYKSWKLHPLKGNPKGTGA